MEGELYDERTLHLLHIKALPLALKCKREMSTITKKQTQDYWKKIQSIVICLLLIFSTMLPDFTGSASGSTSFGNDISIEDSDGTKLEKTCVETKERYESSISANIYYELYTVDGIGKDSVKFSNQDTETNYTLYDVLYSDASIDTAVSLEKYKVSYLALQNALTENKFSYQADANYAYSAVMLINDDWNRVLFFVFTTGTIQNNVDKSSLNAAIATAPKVDGSDALHHHENDRYNGNETSQKGFWEEYKTAYANAEKESKSDAATEESVARALSDLQNAISKLIPSSQANTTLLYEALQDIQNLPETNEKWTEVSWSKYVEAKGTAQTVFDGLFEEKEGKRVATENNKAEKQGEIDNAATVLTAAKEDLLESKGLEERIALWKEASTWLLAQNQQVQQGQYTEASKGAWNTAYASLQKAKQEGYQTQSRYDAYTSSVVALSTAYYNLQDSNTKDITVHVRVADNFGAMFPEYAIQDPVTATFDKHVTLGSGNKTISTLLREMSYNDTPKTKTPSSGTQYGEGWKNPEVMVYINGTLAVNRGEQHIDS